MLRSNLAENAAAGTKIPRCNVALVIKGKIFPTVGKSGGYSKG
jgi:hypothetical protein